LSEQETLFEFPCDFPVKAFGYDTGDFDAVVLELVRAHAPEVDANAVTQRNSRGGRYLAVTVTVRAVSRDQLDRIYHALSADERVLVAL
jgi:putative lipoic acid-binding regulatory protein